jgi:hypothetical protein
MKFYTQILVLLLLAACLAGCDEIGALTPQQATRQSLQHPNDKQAGVQILGDYRLPDGKSLVVFSFTPKPEDGKTLTALGYSLLERSRLGLWQEVNRGTYIKEARDLTGEWIDYEIVNQPGEAAAVFGRVLSRDVGEVVAIYDDLQERRDFKQWDGFAFFSENGAYPASLKVLDKDGKVLQTEELSLMESMAMETLTQFFSYLHDGLYADAARLYGGSYQELADMNSLIDPADNEALWENACKINGFQCLYVESIGPMRHTSPTEFTFLVGFMDTEGNSFRREACCGDTSSTPQKIFEFRVQKAQDGRFKVMDLPVYVP